MSYDGEPEVVYERPGPIKRAATGERGAFEFEDEEPGGAGAAGGSGGSSGNSTGSVSLASANGDRAGKAERQLLSGLDCADCPGMVVIRPGVFRIGADEMDLAAEVAERPTRMIGISTPFAIGRNEVTRGEYMAFVTATGRQRSGCSRQLTSDGADPHLPVTCVSAHDADAYASWLARRTGQSFRLPSEAEWEFAARAGATGPYVTGSGLSKGDANVEHRDGNVLRVGSYPTNGFGLNDMHGNAAEIIAGCWVASPSRLPGDGSPASASIGCRDRVVRDGHAGEPATKARLSARRPIKENVRLPGIGFRLARDLK